ncbi:MAG TPA: transcriptional repressor LexA [Candidatus Deferrimicrobium sp.]|nr:transcriptional repressor LexA [Candidatus Deferrimicrobium sp.]
MAAPLTPTQRRVLDFLREFVERHRFAPTAADIASSFGIAVKNGFYYLELLERKGYIRRKRHHPRRIEFVGENLSRSAVRIPVLGRVPAGGPREAIEEVEGELLLDPDLVGEGEVFSLRVKGDSMTGAHICDGDHVLVRSQARAEEGEIVVAVIDGEATVKRFRRWKGKVRLEAANPAYPPIVVPAGAPSFRIAGKVVGVYRKL